MKSMRIRWIPIFLVCLAVAGCNSSSSDSAATSSAPVYSSVADDMRACAPDLASSVSALSVWASGDNGWSGHVQYGVLKKHFDSSSGTESLYATVLMVDQVLSDMFTNLPEAVWTGEGQATEGDWTIDYGQADGDVSLPEIFGGGVVSDFENSMTMTGTEGGGTYQSYFYFKRAGSDNIEKILYRFQISAAHETGAIYVVRNTATKDITVWTTCLKAEGGMPAAGAAHVDGDFRCLLYFEGNTAAQSFKFKLKTDAAEGWAFWGGGSTATDDSVIAVRGTDAADTQTYANDGTNVTDDSNSTYYVMLTFGDMKDSTFDGDEYPKEGTNANLLAETDPAVAYIILGNEDCLHSGLASIAAFMYPEDAGELGYAG